MKKNRMQADYSWKAPLTSTLIVLAVALFLIPACQKELKPEEPVEQELLQAKMKLPDLEMIADNLVSPIGVIPVPDNTGRLFIIDQVGKIWIVNREGTRLSTPFLDISSRLVTLSPGFDERGLLGLAFHPNYRSNGRFCAGVFFL